jgi:hypothetical protein
VHPRLILSLLSGEEFANFAQEAYQSTTREEVKEALSRKFW